MTSQIARNVPNLFLNLMGLWQNYLIYWVNLSLRYRYFASSDKSSIATIIKKIRSSRAHYALPPGYRMNYRSIISFIKVWHFTGMTRQYLQWIRWSEKSHSSQTYPSISNSECNIMTSWQRGHSISCSIDISSCGTPCPLECLSSAFSNCGASILIFNMLQSLIW